MARQRFQLTSNETLEKQQILHGIQSGTFSKEDFNDLSPEKQKEVNDLLFELSASGINLFHGTSALEFIVISALRIMFRYKENTPLSEDDRMLESFLEDILKRHELGNSDVASADWLFDYLSYAKFKTDQILLNREEHIERKRKVTGKS